MKLLLSIATFTLLLVGCDRQAAEPATTQAQDPAIAAPLPNVDWPLHGLEPGEGRFSPLADINSNNVAGLGLAWHYDYPTNRGLEATPLVVDGIIYTTASWSIVFAHDARSGELKWMYDPQVPGNWAVHLCCDVVNRGVAHRDGRIFSGTLDGRLLAIDAASGKLLWEVQTTDTSKPYSITGAPRIVKDKVLIGNGGSEMGVRGYVSAYNVEDGSLDWRFYTVPGNPAESFEHPALEKAAETWGGGPWWEFGGGGTVWDSMAYDADLNLLYIGVGNGAPWNRQIRSPDGGDNLFLSSIVALNPDDGSYAWHYQTTPGETWDYTATQHLILADLEIGGETRQVIMQAPKNGFFYVLDRATGELLSADAYAAVTWASHVDLESGRPVETEGSRYLDGKPGPVHFPSPIGAHNWHPMSHNPETGLVYIPVQDMPWIYQSDAEFEFRPGFWNTGTDFQPALLPDDETTRQQILDLIKGAILAWDPVAKEPRWRVEHRGPWNGGILSTAGNLVLQGNGQGELVAYRADDGQPLWRFDAQTGIVAPPITYRLNGEQYVAVVAGWGGVLALSAGEGLVHEPTPNRSRLLVFKIGGDDSLPPVTEPEPRLIAPPEQTGSAEQIADGKRWFTQYCMACHGDGAIGGTIVPDLRALTAEKHALWDAVVLGGMHWQNGMIGFGNEITREQADNIHHYVIERAHFALRGEAQ